MVTLGIVLTLGLSFGVLGNIAVIVSICGTKNLLRNNHYYLLLHLAVCDVLFLMFYVEVVYGIFNIDHRISSKSYLLCKFWLPIHTVLLNAGPMFLVLISLVRYRAIVYPFKRAIRRKTLYVLSGFVYVFSIICVIPYVLVLKFDETTGCNEVWPFKSLNIAYTLYLTSVQYFIPAIFLSVIYFIICKKLMTQNKIRMKAMKTCEVQRRQNKPTLAWFLSPTTRNGKSFLVSFTIVSCFIISACPQQVSMIIYVISSKKFPSIDLWLQAFYVFGTLVLNPFVYGALDNRVFSLFTRCRKSIKTFRNTVNVRGV